MADDTEATEISLASAASIGIGGMVGAGIFAILGLAATTTQGAVPIAFVIGGVIALVTAHCYGKLSVAFPDRGGTVAYGQALRDFGCQMLDHYRQSLDSARLHCERGTFPTLSSTSTCHSPRWLRTFRCRAERTRNSRTFLRGEN